MYVHTSKIRIGLYINSKTPSFKNSNFQSKHIFKSFLSLSKIEFFFIYLSIIIQL